MNKYEYACDVAKRTDEELLKAREEGKFLKVWDVFEEIIHQDQTKEYNHKIKPKKI